MSAKLRRDVLILLIKKCGYTINNPYPGKIFNRLKEFAKNDLNNFSITLHTYYLTSTNYPSLSNFKRYLGIGDGKLVRLRDENLENLISYVIAAKSYQELISELDSSKNLNKNKLPHGILKLHERYVKNQHQTYSTLLNSEYLKYLKRSDFKKRNPDLVGKAFLDEDDYIKLILKEGYLGIIISGKGGVGKTRLMLELGLQLMAKDIEVLEVNKHFNNLVSLEKYIKSSKFYILLFDYLEEQELFEKIIDWITYSQIQNIKIIANCRKSHVLEMGYDILDFFEQIIVGENQLQELEYTKWVTSEILLTIDNKTVSNRFLRLFKSNDFLEATPSIAAFVKYLYIKNSKKQFRLMPNEKFADWLTKQFKRSIISNTTESAFYEKYLYVFQIIACLPSKHISINKLYGKYGFEIKRLLNDGWIDNSLSGTLDIAHHTVSENLIVKIFTYHSFNHVILIKFLDFSYSFDSTPSLLWLIQRVWRDAIPESVKPLFQQTIYNFLINKINKGNGMHYWFVYKFHSSPIITQMDKLKILIKHKSSLLKLFEFEWFGFYLSYCMQWLSTLDKAINQEYLKFLKEMYFRLWNRGGKFDYVFYQPILGSRIISSYINAFGIDRYISNKFFIYVEKVACDKVHFLYFTRILKAWIEQEDKISEEIKPTFIKWLEKIDSTNTDKNSTIILRLWLENGNDPEMVKKTITNWIDTKGHLFETVYLVGNWLKYGNDISIVKQYLIANFFEFSNYKYSNIVIEHWLIRGGDLTYIDSSIKSYLNFANSDYNLNYIPSLWLEKSKNPNLLSPYLDKIKKYCETPYLYKFINLWLKLGGDLDLIHPIVGVYIENNNDVSYNIAVVQNFERKGGDISNFRKYIEVKDNELYTLGSKDGVLTEKDFRSRSLFLTNQLKTKEATEVYSDQMVSFLEQFRSKLDTSHAIVTWLEAGGDFSVLEKYILLWLEVNNGASINVSYVISTVLENSDGFACIKNLALEWLACNTDNYLTKYPLSSWLKFHPDGFNDILGRYIENYCKNLYDERKHDGRDTIIFECYNAYKDKNIS